MRKAQVCPCRLLPLLLLILLSVFGVHTVHGSSGNHKVFVFSKNNPALKKSDGDSFLAQYRLSNLCSDNYVRIRKGGKKGKVDSRGRKGDKYTKLVFQSYAGGNIYIRGVHNYRNKYICFNKKGKVILRHNAHTLCLFRQVPFRNEDNVTYYQLRSVANPQWYLGFNKKGRRLKGYMRPGKEKCFQFSVWPVRPPRRQFSPMDRADPRKIRKKLLRNS